MNPEVVMNFKNLLYLGILILAYGCGMKNSDNEKKPIFVVPSSGGLEICYDGVVYLLNNVNSNKFSSIKFNRDGYIQTCDGDK
jgi:hypothetical protein